VGHYYAYYAAIAEFQTPFMRPALDATEGQVALILRDGH